MPASAGQNASVASWLPLPYEPAVWCLATGSMEAGIDLCVDAQTQKHDDCLPPHSHLRAPGSPFQIDGASMAMAKPTAIFMNCLPAVRGEEQTAEVLDGPQVWRTPAGGWKRGRQLVFAHMLRWHRSRAEVDRGAGGACAVHLQGAWLLLRKVVNARVPRGASLIGVRIRTPLLQGCRRPWNRRASRGLGSPTAYTAMYSMRSCSADASNPFSMPTNAMAAAQSVIYDQAENRLHAQKALLALLVNGFDYKL